MHGTFRPVRGEIKLAYRGGNVGKLIDDSVDMLAADILVILNNDDVGTTKVLVKGWQPFPALVVLVLRSAARVAGGGDADAPEIVHILLALDDKDRSVLGDGFDELGQAVEHALDVVELPNPV